MRKILTIIILLLSGAILSFGQVLPSAPKPQPATPQKSAPKPAAGKATQTIKFFSNAEADLYIDGVKKGRLKPEIALPVALSKGEYVLKIVSAKNKADVISKVYNISETGDEVLYQVDLQSVINQRLALEEVFSAIIENMVLVEGGSFDMGSNEGENSEKPVHRVTISSFYIGTYEVTFAEYDVFCEATGRQKPGDNGWGRGNRPVTKVSWADAVAYCSWLSEKTGKKYRLPTEGEWEFAARGGNKSKGYIYSGSNSIDQVAWYRNNSSNKSQAVGQKQANELGLYDMSGNLWEWCSDWYGESYYNTSPVQNPKGPASGTYRVIRGGSWTTYSQYNRVTNRSGFGPNHDSSGIFGFRVVRVP